MKENLTPRTILRYCENLMDNLFGERPPTRHGRWWEEEIKVDFDYADSRNVDWYGWKIL